MFRFKTLNSALKVTGGKGARYPWESTESGDEGTPPGPWMYEVHHIAVIALESWIHFLYTQSKDFLKNIAYPVIKECAEYFRLWHVYEINEEKAMIGACTDLDETVFPVKNPVYTSCGIIRTFLIAAKASEILKTDNKLRLLWRRLAEKLLRNLPFDGEKYIPFHGATHQSLCSLGILFPFEVLNPEDERVRRTVFDYRKRCHSTVGWKGGSTEAYRGQNSIWNTAWLAICLARMGEGELAYDALKRATLLTNTFGSVNEQLIDGRVQRPWFTTGAGAYAYALNEMLVQSTLTEIKILPAIPSKWRNLSFKLRCKGNILIEVKVFDGLVKEISLESPKETSREVLIPKNLIREKYKIEGGTIEGIKDKGLFRSFKITFKKASIKTY